jgi:hypothetical protein
MTTVRATLEGAKRKPIELQVGEQVTIGHTKKGALEAPHFDLAEISPDEQLESVAPRHAILTYIGGDFRIATVDDEKTFIGQYKVAPRHFLRVVDGDLLRFGEAEFIFHIEKLAESPSPVTSASVED